MAGRLTPSDGDPGPPEPDERESAYGLLQRGQALIRDRHHAQAAVVLERAAALEPGRGSILEPLGRAYFLSRQYERAHATFAALLDVDPTNHWGHYAISQALRKLERPVEARTHLRLAVALAPATALYRRALGAMEPRPDRPPADEAKPG